MIGKINTITFNNSIHFGVALAVRLRLAAIVGWGLSCSAAIAAPLPALPPSAPTPLLNLEQFQQGICPNETAGVTETTPSPSTLTLPSLWWVRDQVAAQPLFGNKLIEKWLACAGLNANSPQVDILVNTQLWTLLTYWERYEVVHRLGTVAIGYGYNLRVFNRQQAVLATYQCEAQPGVAPPCTLSLDSASRGGFRGSSSVNGGFPTAPGAGPP